jgi:hypothetical protein
MVTKDPLHVRLLARALGTAAGFWLVKRIALHRHHGHLYDKGGPLYMGRWRVIDEFKRDIYGRYTTERTLASRVLERLTGYTAIRLHHIAREDRDRHLHNHPFDFRTFILHGWYAEEREQHEHGHFFFQDVSYCYTTTLRAGDTGDGKASTYHRIREVSEGGVWTLFCMTRNTDKWGFKVDGQHEDSVRYFLRRKYDREQIKQVMQ